MAATGDWLTQLAETRPGEAASVADVGEEPVRVVSFSELDAMVNRLANALVRGGVGVGARVAWCSRNAIEVFVLANAARRIGALVLPLNHQLQRTEVAALLAAARASVVWAHADFAGVLAGVEDETPVREVVIFGGVALAGQTSSEDFLAGCPTDGLIDPAGEILDPLHPSFIGEPAAAGPATFTGGTTGKPKGILYNRDRLLPDIPYQRIEEVIYGPDPHVFITSGSLSHGGPASHANAALSRGGTIILQRRFEPEDWLRLVTRYRVTASYCPPTVVRRVCALRREIRDRYDVSSIRVIVAGAAKWSYALKLAYREVFPPGTLWELYGSSELGSNIVMRPEEHWDRPESCGRPVEGYEIVLRDAAGDVIRQPQEPGVMYVKGPFVMFDGYEDDPGATEAARWGDYWTVGDIAYSDEDGYFYICDRSKDMFISGGVNVYPAEVEAVLDSYPGVAESAVFGVPDDEWGERSHALVVARDGVTLDLDGVSAFCRERLARFKAPREIEIVGELPHTDAGKLSKRELRRTYWSGAGRVI